MTVYEVLVVDDNAANLKLITYVLSAKGYRVVPAADAREAFAALKTFRPALILLDLQLPGIDGFEVSRLLRADPATATIPIVAVTAFAMKGDEERIREGGCEAYLSKPISVGKFIETVRRFIG